MNRIGRWLAGIVMAASLLTLGLLPSAAQETAPAKPEPPPAQAAESPKPDADAPEPEEAEEENRAPDERVSADNNISFPVDI